MNFINDIKKTFRKLTPIELAAQELVEAEISKLDAESAAEYAKSVVEYNAARIKRLRAYLQTNTEAKL